jgi:hypothetical protein
MLASAAFPTQLAESRRERRGRGGTDFLFLAKIPHSIDGNNLTRERDRERQRRRERGQERGRPGAETYRSGSSFEFSCAMKVFEMREIGFQ